MRTRLCRLKPRKLSDRTAIAFLLASVSCSWLIWLTTVQTMATNEWYRPDDGPPNPGMYRLAVGELPKRRASITVNSGVFSLSLDHGYLMGDNQTQPPQVVEADKLALFNRRHWSSGYLMLDTLGIGPRQIWSTRWDQSGFDVLSWRPEPFVPRLIYALWPWSAQSHSWYSDSWCTRVMIPLWPIPAFVSLMSAWRIRRRWTAVQRRRRGHCISCGYDQTSPTSTLQCPECGCHSAQRK